MAREKDRERLIEVLGASPELREILLTDKPLEEKRRAARAFLSRLLTCSFEDNPDIPSLEWVLARDAIVTLRGMLSARSERLAGFSFLGYLDELIHKADLDAVERPTRGFFSELDHLLRGVMGKTAVYAGRVPAFAKHEGRKAARMRSEDLSRLARGRGSSWTSTHAVSTTTPGPVDGGTGNGF